MWQGDGKGEMKRIGKNVDLPGGSVEKNLPASAGNVVQFLVGESSTCHGVAKPVGHSY